MPVLNAFKLSELCVRDLFAYEDDPTHPLDAVLELIQEAWREHWPAIQPHWGEEPNTDAWYEKHRAQHQARYRLAHLLTYHSLTLDRVEKVTPADHLLAALLHDQHGPEWLAWCNEIVEERVWLETVALQMGIPESGGIAYEVVCLCNRLDSVPEDLDELTVGELVERVRTRHLLARGG